MKNNMAVINLRNAYIELCPNNTAEKDVDRMIDEVYRDYVPFDPTLDDQALEHDLCRSISSAIYDGLAYGNWLKNYED